MMTYQLLISTMHQQDYAILDRMHIDSDAIVINQCDCMSKKILRYNDHIVMFYSLDEKGVGLSRNSAMMRSTADIIEFADDDMIFVDAYHQKVLYEFETHPEADAILFSVESLNFQRPLLKIDKFARVHRREALKYGCARLAIRREKVFYNNLSFSLLFGGGAKYSSGEDTLFLQDCIRAGLKIYKSPIKVADISQENSTWFKGYTDKFFMDKGELFAAAMPRFMCYIYAILSTIKRAKTNKKKRDIMRLYLKGIKEYKKFRKGGQNE